MKIWSGLSVQQALTIYAFFMATCSCYESRVFAVYDEGLVAKELAALERNEGRETPYKTTSQGYIKQDAETSLPNLIPYTGWHSTPEPVTVTGPPAQEIRFEGSDITYPRPGRGTEPPPTVASDIIGRRRLEMDLLQTAAPTETPEPQQNDNSMTPNGIVSASNEQSVETPENQEPSDYDPATPLAPSSGDSTGGPDNEQEQPDDDANNNKGPDQRGESDRSSYSRLPQRGQMIMNPQYDDQPGPSDPSTIMKTIGALRNTAQREQVYQQDARRNHDYASPVHTQQSQQAHEREHGFFFTKGLNKHHPDNETPKQNSFNKDDSKEQYLRSQLSTPGPVRDGPLVVSNRDQPARIITALNSQTLQPGRNMEDTNPQVVGPAVDNRVNQDEVRQPAVQDEPDQQQGDQAAQENTRPEEDPNMAVDSQQQQQNQAMGQTDEGQSNNPQEPPAPAAPQMGGEGGRYDVIEYDNSAAAHGNSPTENPAPPDYAEMRAMGAQQNYVQVPASPPPLPSGQQQMIGQIAG